MAAASVSRGRDGIPAWDGTPSSFEEYSEQCLIYEQSTPTYKRYLVGPKLIGELSGAAKRLIAGQPATWLSHDEGVNTLLRHLRACLGRPQIPELTEHLNRYFRQGRRKPQESMNEYISRKCEVYLRACQAMQRVAPYHKDSAKATNQATTTPRTWSQGGYGGYAGAGWSWGGYPGGYGYQDWQDHQAWNTTSRRNSTDTNASDWGSEAETPAATQAAAPVPSAATTNTDDDASERSDHSWQPREWWHWQWAPSWGNSSRATTQAAALPELLPEFIQGWYLLQDAGLTPAERNLIQTAVQNDFSLQRVAQELRSQFHDIDQHRRDHRPTSYLGTVDEEDELEEEGAADDGFAAEDLDPEDLAMWTEAAQDIEQACAIIQNARRTLKEARAKQSAVRLARKYYKPGTYQKPRDDSQMICLKCGVKGHRAANCTDSSKSASSGATQSAPFVCFSDQALATGETEEQALLSTREAVKSGYAVIDGGATRTLGSVAAIQNVMDINAQKYGESRVLSVDLANQPVFGFGNSTENRCASTVELGISAGDRAGQLTIHALDRGDSPILLSVASLRSLGAIIDFSEDLICFRHVDPGRILSVERSTTGHQLLPLTENLYKNAKPTNRPVPSLAEYVQISKNE
ncbi:GIP [Symbiodinium sp. CCMP2592]|nr:GIP [Symbiodinium sp. CCMP2592]